MEHRQLMQDLENEQREKNRRERERRQQKKDYNKYLLASTNQKLYNQLKEDREYFAEQ